MYNVNNQVMNSADYVYALRFVVDENTTLHRFISGFNLEGSDQLGGRTGYADGNGGTIRARLVAVEPNGEPDLSQVLAEETVGAWQRYQESKSAYGAPGLTQLLHFNMGGVQLQAGRMYAMTYQNVDPSPGANWFSENSPTVKESVAGPNGTNTLDPNAPGAIAGLDPREAVAWSKDGGGTWVWGRRAGEGFTSGSYGGSSTGDDGTRLPWYGWQTAPGAAPQSNQPYYAYKESGSYTLRMKSVPKATTLTEAGGYAPAGYSVGVVTVRNVSTGQVGRTATLGGGLVKGGLDSPVKVDAGQTYEISNSGRVLKAEGDSFILSTFKLGSNPWSFETAGHGYDVAQLFALPHPWFASSATQPAPEPEPTPAPEPAPAPVGISPYADKARNQPATASSSESTALAPAKAVDANSGTRWSSVFSDNQWWRVDLGAIRKVDKVSINWEVAYASRYLIETSTDGVAYTLAKDVSISKKGRVNTTFEARGARYLRIVGVKRATRWGISFYDVEVYGPSDS
jgi:hypothetical protein